MRRVSRFARIAGRVQVQITRCHLIISIPVKWVISPRFTLPMHVKFAFSCVGIFVEMNLHASAASSSCEDGITMKLYPVMKSEATPYCLELRCVYGRPSFLYAPTSLMSSFLCVRLERAMCPFSLGLNKRCSFCTS
jgi:hypothetical protein